MSSKVNKNVEIFLLSDSLFYGVERLVGLLLPVLVTNKISNGDVKMIGYVISYYMIVHVLAEFFISKKTSQICNDTKITICNLTLTMMGICVALLGFSTNIWHVFLFQTGISISSAIFYPIKWSLYSRMLDKGNEDFEWGLEDIFSSIMIALCAGVGGFLVDSFGYTFTFILIGIMYVLSGMTFQFISFSKQDVIMLD